MWLSDENVVSKAKVVGQPTGPVSANMGGGGDGMVVDENLRANLRARTLDFDMSSEGDAHIWCCIETSG